MRKLDPHEKEIISKYTAKLPITPQIDSEGNLLTETISLLGSQLLVQGHKEVQGKPIKPKKRYLLEQTIFYNAFDILSSAYIANGIEGLIQANEEYLDNHRRISDKIMEKKLSKNSASA